MSNIIVRTAESAIPDITAPSVISFTPADNSSDVSIDTNVVLIFDEAIQKGAGSIQLRAGSATGVVLENLHVATSSYVSMVGNTITINPSINLAEGTRYFLLPNRDAVRDLAGNPYLGINIYDFLTTGAPDITIPSIVFYNPNEEMTNATTTGNIVLNFSEPVQKGDAKIEIRKGSATGAVVESFDVLTSTAVTFSNDKRNVIINPSNDFSVGTRYFITLASGAFVDMAGNPMASVSNYDFTTAGAPDITAPTIFNTIPENKDTQVRVDKNIEIVFSESIQKSNGSIKIRTESATGTIFESFDIATSPYVSIVDNILTINPSKTFDESTNYFVTVGLGAVQDMAGNRYTGTGSYTFTTDDLTAPILSSTNPIAGASNVAVKPSIAFTFNEPIKKGTGNIFIRLNSADGPVVENLDIASTSVTIAGKILTVKPSTTLQQGQLYFMSIDNGAIIDMMGNSYQGINDYSFSILDNTAPFINNFNPADGVIGMAIDGNIEITFNEPVQAGSGKIEIRHESATGRLFEVFDIGSSTALGFSEDRMKLIIDPSNTLAESSKYFVVFPKGVVKDMANNIYAGSNTYDFITAETLAPPTLLEKNPLPGAIKVPIASNITLTFNKKIQKGLGAIELWAHGSDVIFERFDVATSTKLRFVNNQLIIDPTNSLAQGVTYNVIIPDGAIQDLAGNNYAMDFEYKFTTLDTIAPTITSFNPSDGATTIASDSNITLMFNELIDFGMGSIQLRAQSATGPIVEVFNTSDANSASIQQNVLTLNPRLELKPNTLYFLVISSGAVKDKSGNAYAGMATYDFTTAQDTTGPVVRSFKPEDGVGNVPVDVGIEINFNELIFPGVGNIEIRSGSRLGPVVESFNVANSPHVQFTTNMLTILPTAELNPQTHYFVVLPRGAVKDGAGNLYLGTSTYDFFTTDNIPPIVLNLMPGYGEINVAIHQPIEIIFNENVKVGSGNIEIRLGTSATGLVVDLIPITSDTITIVNNALRINLDQNFSLNTDYFVYLPAGVVQDISGNGFQGIGYSFKTNNNPAGIFYNTLGNDVFQGTASENEVLIYQSSSNNFKVERIGNSGDNWYVAGQGDDLLKNIERIHFSDKRIALDVGLEQNTGQAMLFWSIMNPDLIRSPEWLGQVIGLFDAGYSMSTVFSWAINTVNSLMGPVDDGMVVAWVGQNLSTFSPWIWSPDEAGWVPITASEEWNSLVDMLYRDNDFYNSSSQIEFLVGISSLDITNPEVAEIRLTGIEYL